MSTEAFRRTAQAARADQRGAAERDARRVLERWAEHVGRPPRTETPPVGLHLGLPTATDSEEAR